MPALREQREAPGEHRAGPRADVARAPRPCSRAPRPASRAGPTCPRSACPRAVVERVPARQVDCRVSAASRCASSTAVAASPQVPRSIPTALRRASTWVSSPSRASRRHPASARARRSAARSWSPTAKAAMPSRDSASGSVGPTAAAAVSSSSTRRPCCSGWATASAATYRGSASVPARLWTAATTRVPDVRGGPAPVAAHGRGDEQVQREVDVARRGGAAGDGAQLQDPPGVAEVDVVGQLAQRLQPGAVQVVERVGLRLPEQARDEVRPAQPEAQLRGEQQPVPALGGAAGELGGPLQRRHGRGHRAAPEVLDVGVLELGGHRRRPARRSPGPGTRSAAAAGRPARRRARRSPPAAGSWARPAGSRT